MTGRVKLYLGLLVLGLVLISSGLWLVFNRLTPSDSQNLAGSQWKAVTVNGTGLVEGTYISLYFLNDGSIFGDSGLNIYEGHYTADAPNIRIPGVGSTLIGHSNKSIVEQEETYQDCLENAASYHIDDNYLKIYDASDQELLIFERRPEYPMNPADLASTSWQLAEINGVPTTERQAATLIFFDNGSSGGGTYRLYRAIYDYEFSYKAYGDNIVVTSGGGHRTAEIPEEQRGDAAGPYFLGMPFVTNYRLTANRLELYNERGETMAFEPYEFSFGPAIGSGGRIAFLSRGKGNINDIYIMNPDGSDLVKLARWIPSQMPYHNIWSADGKTLACIDSDNDTGRTWLSVVDTNGQDRRRLMDITDLKMESMALSPNGKTVVLSLDSTRVTKIETPMGNTVHVEITSEPDMDLFAVDVEIGELKRLTDTSGVMEKWPSHSPDGKQIAFVGRIDTETEKNVPRDVFIMDADGSDRRLLAHHTEGEFVFNPDFRWSPDGSRIAYALYNYSISDSEHFTDIFVIDVKEGSLTNLTNTPYVIDSEPAWSPGNRKIAFYSGNMTEGYQTVIIDLDDGRTISLDQGGPSPSWTPDGTGLIFTNPINVFELMVMDADGKNLRTLAVTKGVRISNPIWLSE